MNSLKEIAEIMPIVTAAVALFFGFLAWRFNQWSIRRQARQDHIRMIIEVNRIFIDRPDLHCIFSKDNYISVPEMPNTPEAQVQKKALIDLFINMFDAVFDFVRPLKEINARWRTKVDEEYLNAWEATIREFFQESPEAKSAWERDRHIYSKGFVKWIDGLIAPADEEILKKGAGL